MPQRNPTGDRFDSREYGRPGNVRATPQQEDDLYDEEQERLIQREIAREEREDRRKERGQ